MQASAALFLLFTAICLLGSVSGWASKYGDSGNTNYSPLLGTTFKSPTQEWKVSLGSTGSFPARLLVDSDGCIIAVLGYSNNQQPLWGGAAIQSFFPNSTVRWTFNLTTPSENHFFLFTVAGNGLIFVDDENLSRTKTPGVIYALNNKDGSVVWSLAIDDHGNVASDHPLLYDEKQDILFVYSGCPLTQHCDFQQTGIYAIQGKTGKILWFAQIPAGIAWNDPKYYKASNTLYAFESDPFGSSWHWVRAFDVASAKATWRYNFQEVSSALWQPSIVVSPSGDVLLHYNSLLTMIDGSTGLSKWNVSSPCSGMYTVKDIAISQFNGKDQIYLSCMDYGFQCRDAATGDIIWKKQRPAWQVPNLSPGIRQTDGLVIFSAGGSQLWAVSGDGDLKWKYAFNYTFFEESANIFPPVVGNDVIYFLTSNMQDSHYLRASPLTIQS